MTDYKGCLNKTADNVVFLTHGMTFVLTASAVSIYDDVLDDKVQNGVSIPIDAWDGIVRGMVIAKKRLEDGPEAREKYFIRHQKERDNA